MGILVGVEGVLLWSRGVGLAGAGVVLARGKRNAATPWELGMTGCSERKTIICNRLAQTTIGKCITLNI